MSATGFCCALLGWAGVIIALWLQADSSIIMLLLLLSLLLTTLTAAHILVFALRHARGKHLSDHDHIVKNRNTCGFANADWRNTYITQANAWVIV